MGVCVSRDVKLLWCYFVETAINIGYSCKLLRDEMSEIFVIDSECSEGVERQLKDAKEAMLRNLNEASTQHFALPADVRDSVRKDPTSFAVIINGHSLVRKCGCCLQFCSSKSAWMSWNLLRTYVHVLLSLDSPVWWFKKVTKINQHLRKFWVKSAVATDVFQVWWTCIVTCRICSGFRVPKITKICLFLTELNITRRHHYAWAKMRPTVTVEAWSVYMCVLATIVSPEKTAAWIEMPCGIWSCGRPTNYVGY